jgi:glycosyltransferase involved in cell wall biosynthesis
MKVLHILDELKHSGAEVMLQLAFEKFSSNGIESHILSTGRNIGDYAVVLQQTGYRIHHIPFRKSPIFFMNLRYLLKAEQFTAVHIHTERAFIWYVILLNISGVQTIIRTFHSVFLFESYLRWKRLIHRKISNELFHTIHHAVGDSVLKSEKERFWNDCILIRNWTDVKRFRPPNDEERANARYLYNIHPDEFAILTVGSCTKLKNHMAVFSAVKRANDLLGKTKVVTIHVGSGPLLKDEELYTSRNCIKKYCRFVGTLNDVRPCLYAADSFVMTSQGEGLPVSALEAMSTGLPVILYNVHGLKDLLQNGYGGLLIDPVEDCLVEALLLMADNPDFREVKGKEAREIILRDYSLEDSVDRLIRLYTARHYG